MTARRLGLTLAAASLPLAGCGAASGEHSPDVGKLPLVSGARIVAQKQKCDRGGNAFCGWELVIAAPGYRSSDQLLLSEHDHLKSMGWTGADADIAGERAADSPGHKLHLIYGTAFTDLRGIDRGKIHRTRKITLTLSHAMFERTPSLSMLLEEGSG
jgi:hypothetical protein